MRDIKCDIVITLWWEFGTKMELVLWCEIGIQGDHTAYVTLKYWREELKQMLKHEIKSQPVQYSVAKMKIVLGNSQNQIHANRDFKFEGLYRVYCQVGTYLNELIAIQLRLGFRHNSVA